MKAAICHEFSQPLTIEEVTLDPPETGEVSVKLNACAICHSDILYMEGAWGGTLPAIYGHEAAGVVDATGPGVTRVQPGDHVVVTLLRSCGACYFCAQGETHLCEATFDIDQKGRLHDAGGRMVHQGLRTGAFAEQVVVDSSQVVKIPNELPLECAALLACGVITGYGAVVNTAGVTAGSSVVVIGTGGVGLNSVQGAAIAGAQPVIAIDVSQEKLQAAKKFGATHAVTSMGHDLAEAVKDLTQGRGADFVFVTVGNTAVIESSVDLLRRGGTMVIVGMTASGVKATIEPLGIANNSKRILGSKMGSSRLQVDVPKLIELYQQGRLKLDELISGRYPLSKINEAVASVKNGEALRNIIVFE